MIRWARVTVDGDTQAAKYTVAGVTSCDASGPQCACHTPQAGMMTTDHAVTRHAEAATQAPRSTKTQGGETNTGRGGGVQTACR